MLNPLNTGTKSNINKNNDSHLNDQSKNYSSFNYQMNPPKSRNKSPYSSKWTSKVLKEIFDLRLKYKADN